MLAIGDGPNDRELLAGAAIAVAPADGHPDVVRDADHVVGSPRDGGWAEILDLMLSRRSRVSAGRRGLPTAEA